MNIESRKILDKSFTGLGFIAIAFMGLVLVLILSPIVFKGAQAYLFTETVEHRRFQFEKL